MFFVVGVGVVAGGVFCVPLAQSRGSVFGGLCIVSCQWKFLSVWLSGQRKDYFVPTAHCLEAVQSYNLSSASGTYFCLSHLDVSHRNN